MSTGSVGSASLGVLARPAVRTAATVRATTTADPMSAPLTRGDRVKALRLTPRLTGHRDNIALLRQIVEG